MIEKLKNSSKKYDAIDQIQIKNLFKDFNSVNTKENIEELEEILNDFSSRDWVTINDIINSAKNIGINFNYKTLRGLLTRKSVFMDKVSGTTIKNYLIPPLESLGTPQEESNLNPKSNLKHFNTIELVACKPINQKLKSSDSNISSKSNYLGPETVSECKYIDKAFYEIN